MSNLHNRIKIIKLLLDNKTNEFSIRKISEKSGIDYKGAYIAVKQLEKENIINIKKIGNINACKPNYINHPDILKAEFIRRDEILRNMNLKVIYLDVKEKRLPFFILLLFGSYATKTQRKNSDIDLMLITDDKETEKEISRIVSNLPLQVHLLFFGSSEFFSMIDAKSFNVGNEAFNSNVILFGAEDYYRLIENARKGKNQGSRG